MEKCLLIFFLMISAASCKKDTPERHGKNFTFLFYDSFSSKPVSDISIVLQRTICELPPFFCDTYFLDTFITDSSGKIYFSLEPEELDKINEFALSGKDVPEQYLNTGYVQGTEFNFFQNGRNVNVKPACFLELRDIDIFPRGSKSCDFYFLDVISKSYKTSIISWTYSDPIRSTKVYHKFRPGLNDTFRARFGCASFRDTQFNVISSYPFDTIIISDYFHP